MALKEGDVLNLQRSAQVWLSQYESLRARVSVTRTLGSDPEMDREEMDRELYVELRRSMLVTIHDRNEMEALIGAEGQVTRLIRHCEQVVEEGPDGESAKEAVRFPRRKEGSEKGRAKASRRTPARKKSRRRSQA